MSVFERYLTVWVFLCIVVGIALGQFLPGVFQVIGGLSIAQVNLPVGLLIWVMIIPMLVKVDFGALGQIRRHVKGIGVTLFAPDPSVAGRTIVEFFALTGRWPRAHSRSVELP
jgi:arsenite transporter